MLKLRLLADYCAHRLKAKTRHGVHSPFVYHLVDQVIYNFSNVGEFLVLENEYKNILDVNSIKKIAKKAKNLTSIFSHSFDSPALAWLMHRLVAHVAPCRVIELGVSLGRTSAYINQVNIAEKPNAADFVWINENYGTLETRSYLDQNLPLLSEGSVIVLDAIYRTKQRKQLWQYIKACPRVTVTVDLFWLGLAIVRSTQAEEHFKIKF